MTVVREAKKAGALFGGRTAKPQELEDPEMDRRSFCKRVMKEP
jgi:hypothetical protein